MAKADDDDDEWKVVRRRGRRSAVPAGGRAAGASGARVMNNFAAIAPAGAEDWHGDGDGDGDGDARSSGKTEEERARRRAKKKAAAARKRGATTNPPPAPAPGPRPRPQAPATRPVVPAEAAPSVPALAPREVEIADEPRGDTTDRAHASDGDVVRVGGLIALFRAVVAAFAALLRILSLGAFQLAPSKPRSDDDSDDDTDDDETPTRAFSAIHPPENAPQTTAEEPSNVPEEPSNGPATAKAPAPSPAPVPGPIPGPVPAASGPPVASEYGRLSVAGALGTWTHGKDARDRAMVPAVQRAIVSAGDPRGHGELARCCAVRGDAIVVGGWDGTVRRWRWTRDGSALVGGAPLQGHSDKVEFASASPIVFGDGDGGPAIAVTGSRDSSLITWDLSRASPADAKRARAYTFDGIASGCVDWSASGHPISAVGTRGGAFSLWDVSAGRKTTTFCAHAGETTAAATCVLGGARLFASGGADAIVKVWDPRQPAPVRILNGHRRRVYALAGGADGVLFAGDFADAIASHNLRRGDPSRATIRIPNAPLIDGASAPIAGLQYVPAEGTAGVAGMLISTAARFGDDDDAPGGAVHARVVDATGGWSNTSEHSETFEGASDDAHAGGYLFTLPTEEGLLSCAGASEDASTVAAGTVDGALVAWRRRGGSADSARSALAEWAGDQGRWPVVDAEVTQEGCAVLDGESESDDDEA